MSGNATTHNRTVRVLAVDDDAFARRHLAIQLSKLGHEVTAAGSVSEAQSILIRERSSTFDCLVTDCFMPEQTGLDLLSWLWKHDYTLASIIVSGNSDEDLVVQALGGGASAFIRKPVSLNDLEQALSKAIDSTHRRRRAAATQVLVHDAGQLQRRMNNLYVADELPTVVTSFYHPKFEAGGDSVAFFPLEDERMLAVVADVSGHDLKSALLSAYFQGMLRGMVAQRVPISAILEHFNSFLIHNWIEQDVGLTPSLLEITSLSVCSAMVDLKAGNVTLSSSGFPLPFRIDRDGLPWVCDANCGYPLGWFDPNPVTSLTIDTQSGDHLVVWTDGLEDYANDLQISTWSLAYRLLAAGVSSQEFEWLARAQDDILLVHIALSKSAKSPARIPVIAETYDGLHLRNIDDIQKGWRRSLAFAFPNLAIDILTDILLCMREAVINGLLHGCRAATDTCRLVVVFDIEKNRLRVDVTDPGPGHQFDVETHAQAAEELLCEHRGLLIIHCLASEIHQEHNGASIRIFFNLAKESIGSTHK